MSKSVGCMLMFIAGLSFSACADPSDVGQTAQGTELAAVLSSIDRVLTVFPVDTPQAKFQIGLGPAGSPVTLAVRKQYAVVPLGVFPGVAVIDLRARRLVSTVTLPANSGATGAAFVNDSIVLIGNSSLNTVTPVNVVRGTTGTQIAVGTFPQAIIASGDTAFVLNAELGADFQPKRTGTVTVIAGATPHVVTTIDLTGNNPGAATIGPDGVLYVINSGPPAGTLASIDRRTLRETRNDPAFGDFPGSIAAGADGALYVASFSYGIAVWNPVTHGFLRTPAAALQPGGVPSSSGVGVDSKGRLYALKPTCSGPSSVFRLTTTFTVETEVGVGNCPVAIAFTRVTP